MRYTTLGERHIKQSVSYKPRKHRYPTNRDSTKNVETIVSEGTSTS